MTKTPKLTPKTEKPTTKKQKTPKNKPSKKTIVNGEASPQDIRKFLAQKKLERENKIKLILNNKTSSSMSVLNSSNLYKLNLPTTSSVEKSWETKPNQGDQNRTQKN